ncbi:MAG: protein phosphatase 2C domain-containing protein [Acidobacteriota bacterium]
MTTATTVNGIRRLEVYALTDVGVVRPHNEDNFLIVNLSNGQSWTAENQLPEHPLLIELHPSDQGVLLAVSDGMGGALAGEVASYLAVTQVCDSMMRLQKATGFKHFKFHEHLRFAIERANLFINHQSQRSPEYAGMGATFTGAGLDGTTLYLAQVGDSRAYLFRQELVVQVTTDQSLVEQLIQSGHITREEAETHPYKNVILQALGATPSVSVTVDSIRVCRDDVLLLCSDGLSGKISSQDMQNILETTNYDLRLSCQRMVDLANERGGEDNITVMLLHFTGEGFPQRGEVAGDDHITPIERDEDLPHPTKGSLGLDDEPTQDELESPPTLELTSERGSIDEPTPAELAVTGGLGLTRQFTAVTPAPAETMASATPNSNETNHLPTAPLLGTLPSNNTASEDGLQMYRLVATGVLVVLSLVALIWTFINRGKVGVRLDGTDPPREQTHVTAPPSQ